MIYNKASTDNQHWITENQERYNLKDDYIDKTSKIDQYPVPDIQKNVVSMGGSKYYISTAHHPPVSDIQGVLTLWKTLGTKLQHLISTKVYRSKRFWLYGGL